MLVQKFGGTSVGAPDRMRSIGEIIKGEETRIVVLSAVSGTTNALVNFSANLKADKKDEAIKQLLEHRADKYVAFEEKLCKTEAGKKKVIEIIEREFQKILSYLISPWSIKVEKELLAMGEVISTQLFQVYLEEEGRNSTLLSAFDFMAIDQYDEPDKKYIKENLKKVLDANKGKNIYVTEGYVCINPAGGIDNLKRGGSDYTASLIGEAIQASTIEIWTDIDGMHNNDPRVVDKTFPIPNISFDEAAELAYFGAKILHPTCILPAKEGNIPVKLLNTMQPDAKGTVISSESIDSEIKAIAAKDGITAIKVKSTRMLLAYGFMKSVFEIFEKYRTPVDMITTSEIAVSLTIDNITHLEEIKYELEKIAIVEVDLDKTIVCIVGKFVPNHQANVVEVLDALVDIPIRMISYGGSKYNISILINSEDKNKALQSLNSRLFNW